MLKTPHLYRAISEIAAATNLDLTLRQTMVLLYVAANGPVSQNEVVEKLDLGKGTASKIIVFLGGISDGIRNPQEGYGLIASNTSPHDRRSKILSLTPKGTAFMRRVLSHLDS
jgi:DNA-binding MarR family transcriptional regulator